MGVWEINTEAEKELDIIEGYPTLYRKQIIKINFNGKEVDALVYLINDTHAKYPDKAYLERVLIGYNDFNFDKKYIFEAIDRLPKKRVYILTDKVPERYISACQNVGIETEYGLDYKRVNEFDGLLIPGGGDIAPKYYGQKNHACININKTRDKISIEAIKYWCKNNKPILGICLGIQYINVAFGGTLKQDIPNHKRVSHEIKISENNLLYGYVGASYIVNSRHHQCIDKLGNDLTVIAYSNDSVIEAVVNDKNNIFGVQWHPEDMKEKTIFEIFKTML